METYHQHQNNTHKDMEKQIEEVPSQQHSVSSSPSHDEFSFTISHHSFSTTTFPHNNNKSKSPLPNSLALDLSPADDIFFHGHLLPLQILSHFPSSPRSSTNSMDNFTLPSIELLSEDENLPSRDSASSSTTSNNSSNRDSTNVRKKVEGKSKFAFSLFGSIKGHKGCQVREKEEDKEKQKKQLRFHVIHAVKKYLRMVKPLMIFRGKREKIRVHRQSYSYSSGSVTPRNNKQEFRGWNWREQYSAPASMRTSPTNSGLLLATSPLPPASDSTMEELQAAIQAAIAHCKNSFAKEDKLNC